ncbi:MAG: hypothetical protein PVJ36_09200 [Nitrospirota bacterium]|jgi:predicted lipoprotein with Yx(FWY)xxD motif
MKRLTMLAVVVVAVALAAGAAQGVTVKSKEGVGNYLADSKGMTLYYFKSDSPGKSACTGGCLNWWPIFHSEDLQVPEGLDAGDFGAITRGDGKKQTTFRGYPLYYFGGDSKPGDMKGQGSRGVWFVVDPGKFMMEGEMMREGEGMMEEGGGMMERQKKGYGY